MHLNNIDTAKAYTEPDKISRGHAGVEGHTDVVTECIAHVHD